MATTKYCINCDNESVTTRGRKRYCVPCADAYDIGAANTERAWHKAMRTLLRVAQSALRGDSNDAEHDALHEIAEKIAGELLPSTDLRERVKLLRKQVMRPFRARHSCGGVHTWNDTVTLRLNDHGRAIYAKRYREVGLSEPHDLHDKEIDFTLWDAAHIFGSFLTNGGKVPFDNIELTTLRSRTRRLRQPTL